MEKREKKEQTNAPKKETSKATLIAALAVIVIIVGYYATKFLPDIVSAPKIESNTDSFVLKPLEDSSDTLRTIDLSSFDRSEVIYYFLEIALQRETLGAGVFWTHIFKRNTPVLYYICGTSTDEDLRILNRVASQINQVPGVPHVSRVYDPSQATTVFHIHYSREKTTCGSPALTDKVFGMFDFGDDPSGIISDTTIRINASAPQEHRSSVLQEELIQSLGLPNDSWAYPDSIFYQGYVDVDPCELDWLLLEILYHPAIRTGSYRAEILFTLRNILFPLS